MLSSLVSSKAVGMGLCENSSNAFRAATSLWSDVLFQNSKIVPSEVCNVSSVVGVIKHDQHRENFQRNPTQDGFSQHV